MHIIRVNDQQTETAFMRFPVRIYKNNPHWIRPLDQEIKQLFDPSKNIFFQKGEAERWILTNFRGTMIGRVAAFVHEGLAGPDLTASGGIGFFECIDHQKAAFTLFDQCVDWLSKKGVQTVYGPANFLDLTAKGGLLTEGFSEYPLYGMPYHHDYYQSFFTNYGFRPLHKQYNYSLTLDQETLQADIREKAQRILTHADYRIESINKQDVERFAREWMEIYNASWKDQPFFSPFTQEMATHLVRRISEVMDEKMIYFAYYQDQPVGFFINLPEMNQVFRYMNGKMNVVGKLKYLLRGEKDKKIIALMMGIQPQHQGKGLEAAFITTLFNYIQTTEGKYKCVEVPGVNILNQKVIHLTQKLKMEVSQVYQTYQYIIPSLVDENTSEMAVQQAKADLPPRYLSMNRDN